MYLSYSSEGLPLHIRTPSKRVTVVSAEASTDSSMARASESAVR